MVCEDEGDVFPMFEPEMFSVPPLPSGSENLDDVGNEEEQEKIFEKCPYKSKMLKGICY